MAGHTATPAWKELPRRSKGKGQEFMSIQPETGETGIESNLVIWDPGEEVRHPKVVRTSWWVRGIWMCREGS